MLIDTAKDALRQGRVLELRNGAFSRTVEVHAVGYTIEGHPVMRCWQLASTEKRERPGWKLIRLDEPATGNLCADNSGAPRRGYRRGDRDIERILLEL